MTLGEHLEELRRRVLKCGVALVLAMVAAWLVRGPILGILARPHRLAAAAFELDSTLNFSSYSESFAAVVKACMIAAIVVTSPYLICQVWQFVAPGLFRRERRAALMLGAVSFAAFLCGVLFGYFVFIPMMLRFLLAVAGPNTKPVIMIGSYLRLFLTMTVALGLAFQTPLVIFYLVRWDIVSAEWTREHRKEAILAAFVIGAILTPPDPLSQLMMAVPLILLFELGALVAAPSRSSLLSFARLAAAIILVAALAVAYYTLWPVGRLSAAAGTVQAGSRSLEAGAAVGVRRGELCRLDPGVRATVLLGRGASPPRLLVDGPARFRLYGSGVAAVTQGWFYGETAGGEIEVRTAAARATLSKGAAEFLVPDADTLVVSVVWGSVTVRGADGTMTIGAGRGATFHAGGEPVQTAPIREHWERLFPGDAVDQD